MDTEEKYGLKKTSALALGAILLLTIVGLVATIISTTMLTGSSIYGNIALIIMYVFVIFYSVYGFKLPNNDLIKWEFLLYAFMLGMLTIIDNKYSFFERVIYIMVVMAASYMSAMLKKIDKCKIIIIDAAIFLIVGAFASMVIAKDSGAPLIVRLIPFNMPILWISIASAYIARFKSFRFYKEQAEAEE